MFESKNKISKLSIGLYQGADTDSIDKELTQVIMKAIDFGINNFDVAPNYRNTRSENILGKLIQKNKDVDFLLHNPIPMLHFYLLSYQLR